MKFDISNIPERICRTSVRVGDVFNARGGRGRTALWVVVSLGCEGTTAHMLGLDEEGAIISTASYSVSYFERRERVGYAPDIAEMRCQITPE